MHLRKLLTSVWHAPPWEYVELEVCCWCCCAKSVFWADCSAGAEEEPPEKRPPIAWPMVEPTATPLDHVSISVQRYRFVAKVCGMMV